MQIFQVGLSPGYVAEAQLDGNLGGPCWAFDREGEMELRQSPCKYRTFLAKPARVANCCDSPIGCPKGSLSARTRF